MAQITAWEFKPRDQPSQFESTSDGAYTEDTGVLQVTQWHTDIKHLQINLCKKEKFSNFDWVKFAGSSFPLWYKNQYQYKKFKF